MNLCLNTDSLADLTLDDALDFAAGVEIEAVEIAAGGQSSAPHMHLAELLDDQGERSQLAAKISSRGLRLAAINCSAWPMHPAYGEDGGLGVIRGAIRLAGELGVDKVVTMSGCPGDSAEARTINWITIPWPAERQTILDEQWDLALGTWQDLSEFAQAHGVERIALELHPFQLVYNVPTLLRLRGEIGPVIGANVDPSHFFWQQMDPLRVVAALGPAVQHVHLKDLEFRESVGIAGVLESRAFEDPDRSWIFRTIGKGHSGEFWGSFVDALREIGYDDVLSIENEDPLLPGEAGVSEAVEFIKPLLDGDDRSDLTRGQSARV